MADLDLSPNPEFDIDYLNFLEPQAVDAYEWHMQRRNGWSYDDILTREVMADMASRPAINIDKWVALSFVGNLTTEENLPEYNRLLAEKARPTHKLILPGWGTWNNEWTSEEHWHGQALAIAGRLRGVFDQAELHKIINSYLQNGLSLEFDDAGYSLAYPAVQELATQLTHKAVKDNLPEEETELREILKNTAADEGMHGRFYGKMVENALHSDDIKVASNQMRAIARVFMGFTMPGIEKDMYKGVRIMAGYAKANIFTMGILGKDVFLPIIDGKGKYKWDIENVTNLDSSAQGAQERTLKLAEDVKAADGEDGKIKEILFDARVELAEAA
jgi:hypothetical protein